MTSSIGVRLNAWLTFKGRTPSAEVLLVFLLTLLWALCIRPGPLSLPYFWDEGDVYAPGARWLTQNGFDIRPGHFPDDWSRGHPPLFYLVASFVFFVFGSGPSTAHAMMLPFTALALTATYVLGTERQNRFVGLVGMAALATSPLMMTMGAFLLPEVPLTALTALFLVCVSRQWWWRAAVLGTSMVWIKETGIGAPVALTTALFLNAWREGKLKASRRSILISLIPVLALLLFFVWQRVLAGYFVFPHHQNLFAERRFELSNVVTIVPSVFFWDGRWFLTLVGGLAAFHMFFRTGKHRDSKFDVLDVTIATLFLGNLVFFAKMFWLERYALPVHPGIVVLLAAVIAQRWSGMTNSDRLVRVLVVIVPSALGIYGMYQRGTAPEHSFAFADDVQSHVLAIGRIEAQTIRDGASVRTVLTTWPLTTEMREPWLGFTEHPLLSAHPGHSERRDIGWVLIDESSPRAAQLRDFAEECGMRVHWRIEHRSAPRLEFWGP